MAKKIYAVKVGRIPGIYRTWDECKANVEHYPNAEFKGFNCEDDALAYLGKKMNLSNNEVQNPVSLNCTDSSIPIEVQQPGIFIAYVDGSFDAKTKRYSYGLVLFGDGKEEHFKDSFFKEDATMRNVSGEIAGAKRAMELALERGATELHIYYDYLGIEYWCTGEWQAKNVYTQAYRNFYRNASKQLNINFVKVPAHSGVKYNEMADQLAKSAFLKS